MGHIYRLGGNIHANAMYLYVSAKWQSAQFMAKTWVIWHTHMQVYAVCPLHTQDVGNLADQHKTVSTDHYLSLSLPHVTILPEWHFLNNLHPVKSYSR